MYVLFPYERIPQGSRVIIYGMGWLGKMFVEQIEQNNYCKLLFAVDKEYKSKDSHLVPIKSPEAIQETDYDYIVIALLSVSVAESVKDVLLKQGIPAEKCVYKYRKLDSDEGQMFHKLASIEGFLERRVGRMLSGLESFAENECWRRSCTDWEHSWLYEKYRKLQSALTVYRIDEPHHLVRVGRREDGGYLMVNECLLGGDRTLYSFGVGGDVSFEYKMAENGWQVYMYDHTVQKLPQEHPAFHYQKRGLIGQQDESRTELAVLPELLRENGHLQEQDMLLKMDIEGYEIDVFRYLPEEVQSRFKQIVLELHGLDDISCWDALLEALASIGRTHKLVHLHANNNGPILYLGDGMLTQAVELTFVRTADWHFSRREGLLLDSLDARCDDRRPERLAWQ